MTALKRKLAEERKAALTAHWEVFASTYDFSQIRGADKSRTVLDGPYRGGMGVSMETHLSTRQDDYQSSKKGQYPGQYLQQYKGQVIGDGQTKGQSLGVPLDKLPYGNVQTVRTQYPGHTGARTGHLPYSNPAPLPHTSLQQNILVQVPVRGVSAWDQEGAVSPHPTLPSSSSGCGALYHPCCN